MAKNQKHEKKHNVQHGDKIEISAETRQACGDGKEPANKQCNVGTASCEAGKVETETMTQEAKSAKVGESSSNTSQAESAEPELSPSSLSEEVAKWKNEYLRKAADFENYRKRMIREKKEAIDYANESILRDLVNVLDDFDRGIEAAEKYATEDVKPHLQGFQMIRYQLYSMLESKYSLKYYKSEGEPFDPNIHDVKATKEDEGVEVETVGKELLKGYKLHDRVIRVAQVETLKPKK